MASIKPESPLIVEEVLLAHGWTVKFKDEDVCVLENPKDKKANPICIPQQVGPPGLVSATIIEHACYEARIDPFTYQGLLARVKQKQQQVQAAQTRGL